MVTSFKQAPPKRKICVLLVEDDDADAYLAKKAFSGIPKIDTVVHCHNGFQAVELLRRNELTPDIAFIDLHMPIMDGASLLEHLATLGTSDFPKVVWTSSALETDALRRRVKGEYPVVTKPDGTRDLQQALAEVVEAFAPST